MISNLRTLLFFIGLLFSVSAMAQPANDDCNDAIAVGTVTDFAFSTLNATTDGPFHPGECVGGAPDSMYFDVWYLYTADFTGTAEFTTCGTADFDTNLAAYAPGSDCPPDAGDLLSCSEDGTGCDISTSKTTFDVVSGETYLLRIGGWGSTSSPGGASGSGTFTIQEFDPPTGPPNDECDNAIVLDLGPMDSVTLQFSTSDATTSDPIHGDDVLGCLDISEPVPYNDIWYSYTATFDGYVEYSNCGTASFDSKIAVYGPNQSCPPETTSLLACGDDGCAGFTSVVNFPVENGNTYLLRMGAWSSSGAGFGTITVKRIAPPVPPANDFCMDYDTAWVTLEEFADDFDPIFESFTVNGSSESGVLPPVCTSGNEISDVWFKFNSGLNTDLIIRIVRLSQVPDAQFVVELFDDCLNPTSSTDGPGFCFNTADQPGVDLMAIDVPNFPGEPTEYFLRVSTDLTFEVPGLFFVQLLGEPYVSGVGELELENFNFYPNPVDGELTVQFELEKTAEVKFEILNALGQVSQSETYNQLGSGLQHLQIPVASLQPGIYFFRLQMDEGQKTVRFVKR